jgi:Mg-chelatase subunit ChlD
MINKIKINTILTFVILLFDPTYQLAFATENNNDNVSFNLDKNTDVSYGHSKAMVRWKYSYKLWSLMGEPVQDCIFSWYLRSGQTFSIYNNYTKQYDSVTPPDTVLRKISLGLDDISTTLYGAHNDIAITCDGGALAKPGIIIGLGLTTDTKAASSFNTPGSPNWDHLFVYNSTSLYPGMYLSSQKSKETFKALKGTSLNLPYWSGEMFNPRLDIGAVQSWYNQKLQKKYENKKVKSSKNTNTAKDNDLKQPTANSKSGNHFDKFDYTTQNSTSAENLNNAKSMSTSKQHNSNQAQNQAIKAKISGTTVPIEINGTNSKNSLLLLIDTSGSMQGNKLKEAKSAAKEVIRKSTRNNTEVAILTFSGSCNNPIAKHQAFSTNTQKLLSFVDSLSADGGTPMSAAIEYANIYMANNSSKSSASEMILLLADGDDSCNIMSPVITELKKSGILFHHQTVGLELDADSKAVQDLTLIAKESGGDFSLAADASQLSRTFENAVIAMGILEFMQNNKAHNNHNTNNSSSLRKQSIFDQFGE